MEVCTSVVPARYVSFRRRVSFMAFVPLVLLAASKLIKGMRKAGIQGGFSGIPAGLLPQVWKSTRAWVRRGGQQS